MPTLSVNQLDNAQLSWVVEVFVKEGALQDGQDMQFWTLLFGDRSSAIKPSRVSDTQLHMTVEHVDDKTLGLIKDKLLNNHSLAEDREAIAAAHWENRSLKVAQI